MPKSVSVVQQGWNRFFQGLFVIFSCVFFKDSCYIELFHKLLTNNGHIFVYFVRYQLINRWRRLSANTQSYYQCDQCLFRYSFQRTRWAAWLTSDRVVLSAAVIVCFILTTISAAVVTAVAPTLPFFVYQIGSVVCGENFDQCIMQWFRRFQPFWYFPRHWTAPYFDFYVAGASGISMIGALMYLKREWDTWSFIRLHLFPF